MATEQSTEEQRDETDAQAEGAEAGQAEDAEEQPETTLSAVDAAGRATEQITELTGREADTVSSVGHEDGRWEVGVELVELERMPPSTDVLASYQVVLDEQGRLVQYERVRRYLRSEGSVTA